MTPADLTTTWLGATVALTTGLGMGGVGAWLTTRRRETAFGNDENVADLEERLAHLIAQLRDLDEQATRLTPAAYAAQKSEFEARAAGVLRERERVTTRKKAGPPVAARPASDVSPTIGFFAARPQLRGALWGGGSVGLAFLLYTLVVHEQQPRDAGAPMGMPGASAAPMAGMAPSGGPSGAAGEGAGAGEITALTERLTEKPDDLSALLRLSHLLLRAQMLDEARVVNDRALRLEPQNPEGRVHAAVLRAGGGDSAGAIEDLNAVLTTSPKLAEAWFFRGMLAMQSGDQKIMQESFTHFVEVAPEGPQRDRIRAMLTQSQTP